MKIKKYITALSVSFFVSTSSYSAGIPVIDTAALAQWATQIIEMKSQYDQMIKEYEAFTGNYGMGNILSNAESLITEEGFEDNYLDLISSGASGATDKARAIYGSLAIQQCEGEQYKSTCEAEAYANSENAAFIIESLVKGRTRAEELQDLVAQIELANDPKAAADLTNRIQAEQAVLQNEQTMVNLSMAQRQSQIELIAQKKKAENSRKRRENTDNPARDMFK